MGCPPAAHPRSAGSTLQTRVLVKRNNGSLAPVRASDVKASRWGLFACFERPIEPRLDICCTGARPDGQCQLGKGRLSQAAAETTTMYRTSLTGTLWPQGWKRLKLPSHMDLQFQRPSAGGLLSPPGGSCESAWGHCFGLSPLRAKIACLHSDKVGISKPAKQTTKLNAFGLLRSDRSSSEALSVRAPWLRLRNKRQHWHPHVFVTDIFCRKCRCSQRSLPRVWSESEG